MAQLRSIDLFTGIGGVAHALRGIARPLLYCEIDPECQQVLQSLMRRRLLSRAPLHHDVRTLAHETKFLDIVKGRAVDLVTAGFPCQGFSSLGYRQGLEHTQSSLFNSILAVLDVCKPPLVFLENVAPILKYEDDFRRIVGGLTSRGYSLRWVLLEAAYVGAPHHRRRWFCLARHATCGVSGVATGRFEAFSWARSTEPVRMESIAAEDLRYPQHYVKRWKMLGNAVCPDAARVAFLFLFSGGQVRHANFRGQVRSSFDDAGPVEFPHAQSRHCHYALVVPDQQHPHRGVVAGCNRSSPLTKLPQPTWHLVLDPKTTRRPQTAGSNSQQTQTVLKTPIHLHYWATPRASNHSTCWLLTARSKLDLSTQVRFEVGTTGDRHGRVRLEWVEWLMGYPEGWTHAH
jgi:hypothetical protein